MGAFISGGRNLADGTGGLFAAPRPHHLGGWREVEEFCPTPGTWPIEQGDYSPLELCRSTATLAQTTWGAGDGGSPFTLQQRKKNTAEVASHVGCFLWNIFYILFYSAFICSVFSRGHGSISRIRCATRMSCGQPSSLTATLVFHSPPPTCFVY
jgi:hypothetical protein